MRKSTLGLDQISLIRQQLGVGAVLRVCQRQLGIIGWQIRFWSIACHGHSRFAAVLLAIVSSIALADENNTDTLAVCERGNVNSKNISKQLRSDNLQ